MTRGTITKRGKNSWQIKYDLSPRPWRPSAALRDGEGNIQGRAA